MKVCYRCHEVETREKQAYCSECLSTKRKERLTVDSELKRKIYQHHRRALQYGVESTFTVEDWHHIVRQSNSQCHYCHIVSSAYQLVPDHIIPMSRGGTNTPLNILPACARCNNRKANRVGSALREITVSQHGDDEVIIAYGSQRIRLLQARIPELISKLVNIAS